MKGVLLDQGAIAGIGNIYADEALFHAGINPKRAANTIVEAARRPPASKASVMRSSSPSAIAAPASATTSTRVAERAVIN